MITNNLVVILLRRRFWRALFLLPLLVWLHNQRPKSVRCMSLFSKRKLGLRVVWILKLETIFYTCYNFWMSSNLKQSSHALASNKTALVWNKEKARKHQLNSEFSVSFHLYLSIPEFNVWYVFISPLILQCLLRDT